MPRETQCAWCKKIHNAKTNEWEEKGEIEIHNKTCCGKCQIKLQEKYSTKERRNAFKQ